MHPFNEYLELAKLFWPSLAIAAAIAVAAGVIGVFVLLRRDGLVALAMPQVVGAGAAVALRLGLSTTLWTALGAVAVAVLLLVWAKGRGANHWLLPSLYVAGLAGSFLIIAGSGSHVAELQGLFTGVDVAVSTEQAMVGTPVLLLAGVLCAVFWRRWLLVSQAPPVGEVAGVNPSRWETGFLMLVALIFLLGTSSSGVLMVLALLFLPAAIVLPWSVTIRTAMLAAAIVALLQVASGWVLSIEFDWPLSPSVGGAGFLLLVVSHIGAALIPR